MRIASLVLLLVVLAAHAALTLFGMVQTGFALVPAAFILLDVTLALAALAGALRPLYALMISIAVPCAVTAVQVGARAMWGGDDGSLEASTAKLATLLLGATSLLAAAAMMAARAESAGTPVA